MSKVKGSLDLPLRDRPAAQTLTGWLYEELRSAIIEKRLPPAARLPATRDFAAMYGVSRGTVVCVFDRLLSEGYLHSRVGAGTWVSDCVTSRPQSVRDRVAPDYVRRIIAEYRRPKAFLGLTNPGPSRPFRIGDVDLAAFPSKLWASLAARRVRNSRSWPLTDRSPRGYPPLRRAIAHHLASARGVACTAEQITIVSGVQQGLDLLARLLLKPGAKVRMEDPGYFGARIAFENAGAKIVPVPVDSEGIVAPWRRGQGDAAGVYVTPAHQFPLGMAMSLARRMELLTWASSAGAFIIEDDYDSEFRFHGRPIPALMGLDRRSSVILVGSFSKLLFPSLRIGYVVAPPPVADLLAAFRVLTEFQPVHFEQAVLCDFIEGGHLGRHLRRMRDIYSGRHAALIDAARKYLKGALAVQAVDCGLYTAAYLKNGMSSGEAEAAASAAGIETLSLDRYTMKAADPKGLLLGFGSFPEAQIDETMRRLARVLA
jgi:GntR family transcriptional regulator/MocR family aminotransferase